MHNATDATTVPATVAETGSNASTTIYRTIHTKANAQYTPPTRRDSAVSSRHEFAISWRQFRRVVGVNTPVGSRDQNCKLAADGCVVRSNPSAVVANSCTHRPRRRDATKQFRLVGVGGVYWA